MISPALLEVVACPVCLEPAGCASCDAAPGHDTSCASYPARVVCACGGPDKVRLLARNGSLLCPCCQALYAVHRDEGWVDLGSGALASADTHYADHEFQERLGVVDAEPVLSARVKADMMRRMLAPTSSEALLDLGCGAGKLALHASGASATTAGVDVAPFFLERATRSVDLVRGDLRRLPFRKGAYPAAYSLDVLEHLDEPGVLEVLVEARRVIGPQGRLFVYTHAMESSRMAAFQRGVNRLARRLGRAGIVDHEREAMRKSDHRNAIRSHEHFEELCAAAGLRVAQRRYYNVVFKAVIEDLLLRMYEQARRKPTDGNAHAHPHAHGDERGQEGVGGAGGPSQPPRLEGRLGRPKLGRPAPSAPTMAVARALTWLLKLDVVFFGGIRTGPFFGLLVPRAPATTTPARPA